MKDMLSISIIQRLHFNEDPLQCTVITLSYIEKSGYLFKCRPQNVFCNTDV